MEQSKTNPKEGEPKAAKIESADIKVDFLTAGEKLRNEEEKKLSEERLESFKLSAENDKTSSDVLKESSDKIIRDLAEDYYNNNEDLIRQKTGFYEKNISREAKYDIVKKDEIGAFNDLKNKKGYWFKEHFDKLAIADGCDEIRAQLKSGKTRIESPVLLLNVLERRTKEIENELYAKDKNGALLLIGAGRINVEKKHNQIFSAQVELAEKIYGNNLLGEADKKLISRFISDKRVEITKDIELRKEETLKEIKEGIFGREWSGLDEKARGEYGNDFNLFANSKIEKQIQIIGDDAKKYGIDQKTVLGLMNCGYNLENFKTTGFFRTKFHVADFGKGLSKQEFKQFIKSSQEVFEKEISEQGAQKALKALKEQGDAIIIFGKLREKISKLAQNPDEAEGGIVKIFADIKKKIIAEGIKNSVMKEGKSKEQLEKITQEFGGDEGDKKESISQFLGDIINRKMGLENLTEGDFDENIDTMTSFVEGYGISTDFVDQLMNDEKSGNKWAAGEMGKIRKGYKNNVKKKKGFVSWTIDLMSMMMNPPKEPKKIIKNKP